MQYICCMCEIVYDTSGLCSFCEVLLVPNNDDMLYTDSEKDALKDNEHVFMTLKYRLGLWAVLLLNALCWFIFIKFLIFVFSK